MLHPTLGIRLVPPPEKPPRRAPIPKKSLRPEPPPPEGITTWAGEPALRFLLRNEILVTFYPGIVIGRAGKTLWSGATMEALALYLGWIP